MKPRSKIESAMLALAEKLPPITDSQRQWAYAHTLKKRAILWPRKRQVRCMCCGTTMVYDRNYIDSFRREGQYDCPCCGKTAEVEQHGKDVRWSDYAHFTVLTTFRGYQVARTWEVARHNIPGDNFATCEINEIFQIWITPDGRKVITGRQLHRSAFSTVWDFDKPLGIRRHNGGCTGYFQMEDIYDISGNWLYPDVRVTPLLRRNGWNRSLLQYWNFVPVTDFMSRLLSDSDCEMLVKTGQLDILLHMVRRDIKKLPFRHSVCIANRNGYIVRDAQMWLDYLQMADELGRDTHNPVVVCPRDLKKAHDALLVPAARLRERRAAEAKAREALEQEDRYRATKAPYLGIAFASADGIAVHVLQSVAEFLQEGKAMHHCVFANGYYKRSDSLILSARDGAGNRLETVEVSLRNFTVVQSRARCNAVSPRHEDILALVRDNMHLIRRAKTKEIKAKNYAHISEV